jgi:hypothetical protein
LAGCQLKLRDDPDEQRSNPDMVRVSAGSRASTRASENPVAVLADPAVRAALSSAEKAGIVVPVQEGTTPPNITGYYAKPIRTGEYLASGDGTSVGDRVIGLEQHFTVNPDGSLDDVLVAFDSEAPRNTGVRIGKGTTYRGQGDAFSSYSESTQVCQDGTSDYVMQRVGISSGRVDARGDIVELYSLQVTLEVSGKLTDVCKRTAGNGELAGGWSLYRADMTRVTAKDMRHMCNDGPSAYAPSETWTRDTGEACTCNTDLQVVCSPEQR